MTQDPTLEEIERLDDPRQYVCKRGVPIWVPHKRTLRDKDGKTTRTVTVGPDDLATWAAETNRLYTEDGVLGRITAAKGSAPDGGHVYKPDGSPAPPPTHVGYFRNARVGTFGPKNKPAVLVDCYYKVSELDTVSQRPFRSAEAVHSAKQLRGVALLITDPWLDMGVTTYEGDRDIIRYMTENDMAGMGPSNATPPAPVAGQQQPAADSFSPEEEAQYARMCRYMVQKYNLPPDWPAAGKPAPDAPAEKPGGDKPTAGPPDKKAPPDDDKGTVTPMSSTATVTTYEKEYRDTLAELEAERCKAVIYSLQSEGFQFSPEQVEKETRKLAALPAAEREERKDELRAIYAKQQVPGGPRVEVNPVTPGNQPDPDEFDRKVLVYMRQHPGMTPDEAAEELRKQK